MEDLVMVYDAVNEEIAINHVLEKSYRKRVLL